MDWHEEKKIKNQIYIHKVNNLLIGEYKRNKYLMTVGKTSGQV